MTRKKNSKKHRHVEAKQYATEQPMDHWRNQSGNKKIPRPMGKKHNDPKSMECSKNSSKRELYSNINLLQETGKIPNMNNINLHLKELGKNKS